MIGSHMPRAIPEIEVPRPDNLEPSSLDERLVAILEAVELEPCPSRLLKPALALEEELSRRTRKLN